MIWLMAMAGFAVVFLGFIAVRLTQIIEIAEKWTKAYLDD